MDSSSERRFEFTEIKLIYGENKNTFAMKILYNLSFRNIVQGLKFLLRLQFSEGELSLRSSGSHVTMSGSPDGQNFLPGRQEFHKSGKEAESGWMEEHEKPPIIYNGVGDAGAHDGTRTPPAGCRAAVHEQRSCRAEPRGEASSL